jgi:hypothetical protein
VPILGIRAASVLVPPVLLAALAAPAAPIGPGEIPGLVAWYKVDSLHARLKDGSQVRTWEDSTPNRHDLVFDEKSDPATFHAVALNDLPVVQIGEGNRYAVARPFDLEDHTIFLVCATQLNERALFRSDASENRGVLLFHNSQSHQYRMGSHGHVVSYNTPQRLKSDASITVLGREAGRLRSFVNGKDLSSGSTYREPVRVGVFFDLVMTKFVRRDGAGLHLAEMIFYERYLKHDEIRAVTEYLSGKYAIPVEISAGPAPIRESDLRVHLTSSSPKNLNAALAAVEWNAQELVSAPFRIDLENDATAIHCERDGTLARVQVTLPLRTAVADAGLRVLILKAVPSGGSFEESYHEEEAGTGAFEERGGTWSATLELDTQVPLDAGDYIEIITLRKGGEGVVTLEPGAAELRIAVAD